MKSSLSLALAICLLASELPAAAQSEMDWARLHTLAPGADIIVGVKDTSPRERYLVEIRDSDMTALNLTASTLPRGVVRALQDMVSSHAEYLASISRGEQLVTPTFRMGP